MIDDESGEPIYTPEEAKKLLAGRDDFGAWRCGAVEEQGKVWASDPSALGGPSVGEVCIFNANTGRPHTGNRRLAAAAPGLAATVVKLGEFIRLGVGVGAVKLLSRGEWVEGWKVAREAAAAFHDERAASTSARLSRLEADPSSVPEDVYDAMVNAMREDVARDTHDAAYIRGMEAPEPAPELVREAECRVT